MLSRRLLRVKVMQMVYCFNQRGDQSLDSAEKELYHSISKSHELYHALLLLPVALCDYAQKRNELGKQKLRPTAEELNPNTRFIDNKLVAQLRDNDALKAYVEATALSWTNNEDFISTFYNKLINSELYKSYIEEQQPSYESDKKFILSLIGKELAYYDIFYDAMENTSIYWNDEIEFVISIVVKTLKTFSEDSDSQLALMPEFKDQDDKHFVRTLFRRSASNYKETMDLVKKYSQNWDPDRVALLDIVLIQLAIAEMEEFAGIPVKVTLNEYIEIAKFYSTEKSNVFINGILEKIVSHLVEIKKIAKVQLDA